MTLHTVKATGGGRERTKTHARCDFEGQRKEQVGKTQGTRHAGVKKENIDAVEYS